MTISTKTLDLGSNHAILDGVSLSYDTMTNVATPAATQAAVVAGTGAPTFSATKGTLYLNLTGSSTSTRLYVNNGTTAWVAVTTAS